MSGLRKFLQLRRQSGNVKLAALLFLLAGLLAADLGAGAVEYAAGLGKPVEYVFETNMSGALLEAGMERLREMEGVTAVSRQREYTITSGEKTLAVTELSAQYLTECYGISASSASQPLWLNRSAFESFCGGEAASPVSLTYQQGEEQETGNFLLAEGLPEEEPIALAQGSSLSLGDSPQVRVSLARTDPSGTAITRMESLGFTLRDRETLLTQNYETQLLLTRLGYGLAALALALLAGRELYRAGKKEVFGA